MERGKKKFKSQRRFNTWTDPARVGFKFFFFSFFENICFASFVQYLANPIDYITHVTHLLFFYCKIGDFKIAGHVCLQKKFVKHSYKVFFGDFLNYALRKN